MSPAFARFLLTKVLGWHYTEGLIPEKKAVLLGVPHTSIYDFVLGYIYYRAVGGKMKTIIKKEAFFWPLGPILKSLGGIPIDRSHPQGVLMAVMHEIENSESLHLVICPEGTRKAVRKWKTGYHTIARETGCAVYLGHFDYKTKTLGRGQRFDLTEDARKDTDRIQEIYAGMHLTAKDPSGYTTA